MTGRSILVVEDSDVDFAALQRMMTNLPLLVTINRCWDGDEALDFLERTGDYTDPTKYPRPSLILLDLNLPATDGREVLNAIKQNNQLKCIPVVIFTTSSNPKDIDSCYEKGVNSYIIKPIDVVKLKQTIQVMINYWFELVTLPGD
ncbi:MAG: response regulator [Xenococcaceae cyanobacterium]